MSNFLGFHQAEALCGTCLDVTSGVLITIVCYGLFHQPGHMCKFHGRKCHKILRILQLHPVYLHVLYVETLNNDVCIFVDAPNMIYCFANHRDISEIYRRQGRLSKLWSFRIDTMAMIACRPSFCLYLCVIKNAVVISLVIFIKYIINNLVTSIH